VCRAVKYSSLMGDPLSMKLKNAAETFLEYCLMAMFLQR
jgi:hypothetical protein